MSQGLQLTRSPGRETSGTSCGPIERLSAQIHVNRGGSETPACALATSVRGYAPGEVRERRHRPAASGRSEPQQLSMGIENGTLLGIDNGTLRRGLRGGSGTVWSADSPPGRPVSGTRSGMPGLSQATGRGDDAPRLDRRCSTEFGELRPATGLVTTERGVERCPKTADARGEPPIGQLEVQGVTSTSVRRVLGAGRLLSYSATVFQPRYIGILGFWCGTAVASHPPLQIRLVERMILRCPGPAPVYSFAASADGAGSGPAQT